MATPEELQQDKDFLAASPADQAAYLSSTDQDFAKAPPADQTRYLAHVSGRGSLATVPRPQLEMQAGGGEAGPLAGKISGLPGVNPHTPTTAEGIGDVALAGSALLGPTIPTLARKAAPLAIPAMASYAINKARELPVVGPIINKIPFAEALPWLISGHKGAEAEAEGGAAIERDATRGNEPYAGEEIADPQPKATPIWRDSTRSNVPYAGEAPAGRITASPEPTPQPIQQPATPLTTPISRSRADLMEDKGIQESMQNDLEAHGRIAHDEQARDAAQYRIKPIREARREVAGRGRATIQQTPSAATTQNEDLTEEWSKALEDLKAKRNRQ